MLPLSPTTTARRLQLRQWFQDCRTATLDLFDGMNTATFCGQSHPEFSPVGWHLGHIGYTEALWILERCARRPSQFPQYHTLFAADGLPKPERQNLPAIEVLQDYLATIRGQVFNYLETAPLEREERLWRFLLQHESQHCETVALVLAVQQVTSNQFSGIWQVGHGSLQQPQPSPPQSDMVYVPAGTFMMGSDTLDALDNERSPHPVYLESYWIDRHPVTCREFRQFIQAGGYQNPAWWSQAGWEWLQTYPVNQPFYWLEDITWDNHPVCGVSWYEADAYAHFVGKRLPTEAEWEKAARWRPDVEPTQPPVTYPWGERFPSAHLCNHNGLVGHTTPVNAYPAGQSAVGCMDLLGNVWEWTADWFAGYPGFKPYPYAGYSGTYFDQQHRVLKGGSWATRPWAMRASFRNWYHPWIRQIFAGFRCASSEEL
jgi:ergothioneine biosynthesis protein EgtB